MRWSKREKEKNAFRKDLKRRGAGIPLYTPWTRGKKGAVYII
jgi:hypothetical protein